MSAPNVRNIFRFPCRLIKNPTSFSAAYPYGGTELGIARNMIFRFGQESTDSEAEEFGRIVAVTLTAEKAALMCVLRTYDNDAISSIFPNTTAPTKGRHRLIDGRASGSGIDRAGFDLDSMAIKLLAAPIAPEEHPAILIYNAVPILDASAELRMALGEEFGIALALKATPDATGRDYSIGDISDLTV